MVALLWPVQSGRSEDRASVVARYRLVAAAEDAVVAKDFLAEAVRRKPVSELLVDLGVLRSHSRPHTSNDNPYSRRSSRR